MNNIICPDSAVINHPVHIITKDNQLSPSAFIPYCDFGGEMLTVGANIDQFDLPVCNSFKTKLFNDQLCYEVDLDKFADINNVENELDLGFSFIMDYNEDRQVTFDRNISNVENYGSLNLPSFKKFSMARNIIETDSNYHATIYFNTIGKYNFLCFYFNNSSWHLNTY